jgi:hypothetical protein
MRSYFPSISTREGECTALGKLAEPTKDLLFPIVRVQAWPREKQGRGGPLDRSLDQLNEAFGQRMYALDLGRPRDDLDTAWAARGRAELVELASPTGGYSAWIDFVAKRDGAVPTAIWTDDPVALVQQVERLAALGRGLVFRFRRSQGWNLAQASALRAARLNGAPLLLIFDHEQISVREDLTSVGLSALGAMLTINDMLTEGVRTFVFAGSSFPSQFAEIDPEHARIDIRERTLFDMLRTSPRLSAAGIILEYGDHASVYAAERPPAFRGAPRVDYPTKTSWIYHRCKTGYALAVERVKADALWDDELLCWGAQRIRTAAAGDLTGLNSQTPWVAIRINIHLHLQAHFGSGTPGRIDEPWRD